MALSAAQTFVSLGAGAIAARGRFVVALSGGSTPRDLYQALCKPELRRQLDWNRVEFFWGDERTVPPEHHESNFRMAHDALLEPLEVAPAHIHRIEAERADVDAAADAYALKVADCFRISLLDPPPQFDLVLLGLGTDGHVASLFPGTRALGVTDRWVAANEVPQLSTTRITMTFPLINRARTVVFLVAGDEKAAALADAIDGRHDRARLPSQRVRPASGHLDWFVDRAAASELGAT